MTEKQKMAASHCAHCGCGCCIHSENCPNRQYVCEECTTSNPAWKGCVYHQKKKKQEDSAQ